MQRRRLEKKMNNDSHQLLLSGEIGDTRSASKKKEKKEKEPNSCSQLVNSELM